MTPLDMIKSVKDPKMFVMNTIKNNSNPMIANLIDMANKGDNAGVTLRIPFSIIFKWL